MQRIWQCERSIVSVVTVSSALSDYVPSALEPCLNCVWYLVDICWMSERVHHHQIKQWLVIPEIVVWPGRILLLSPSRPCLRVWVSPVRMATATENGPFWWLKGLLLWYDCQPSELTPPSGHSVAIQQCLWFPVSLIFSIFPSYPTVRLFLSPIQFNSIKPALI